MEAIENRTTVKINLQATVDQDSIEAKFDRYLKRRLEKNRLCRQNLVLHPALTYWMPLILKEEGATEEELEQALIEVEYSFQSHLEYLRKTLGVYRSSNKGASEQQELGGIDFQSEYSNGKSGLVNQEENYSLFK